MGLSLLGIALIGILKAVLQEFPVLHKFVAGGVGVVVVASLILLVGVTVTNDARHGFPDWPFDLFELGGMVLLAGIVMRERLRPSFSRLWRRVQSEWDPPLE